MRVGIGSGVWDGVAVSRRKMAVAGGTAVSAGGVNVEGTPLVGSGTKAAEANVGIGAASTYWQPAKNNTTTHRNMPFVLCNQLLPPER